MALVRQCIVRSDKPISDNPTDYFKLQMVDPSGYLCKTDRCPSGASCTGCEILYTDKPVEGLEDLDQVAVSWNDLSLFNAAESTVTVLDASVKKIRDKDSNSSHRRGHSVSLEDCLHLYEEMEQLGPDDPWHCPKCRALRQAYKKVEIWQLPDIMVIHLKRFVFNRRHRAKNGTYVDFPLDELDMRPFMASRPDHPVQYRLFAISNHMGTMGSGHYTAFARNRYDQKWYLFNDSTCSPIEGDPRDHIVTQAAYVLFYERINKDTQNGNGHASSSDGASSSGLDADSDVQMMDGDAAAPAARTVIRPLHPQP